MSSFDPLAFRNIAEFEAAARRRLPRFLYEFVARGAEDENALANNRAALDKIKLMPRALVDVSKRSQKTVLFGKEFASPLIVAPTGAAGILKYHGEIDVARAAAAENIPYCLSTAAQTSIEDIASKAGGNLWFQLYMWPDPKLSFEVINRAKAAGYEALMVTVDTVMSPNREYNPRNGFSVPMRLTRRNIMDAACHPYWLATVVARYLLTTGMPGFVNDPAAIQAKRAALGFFRLKNETATWADIGVIRKMWDGPLIIKGLLHLDDVRHAMDQGADGVVISNHGGRNLDSAPATIDLLPRICDAVGDKITVLLDSGIRRGSDVVKALALGARAVMTGRAPLWGVTMGGEPGVRRALNILQSEIDTVTGFVGCPNTANLDRRSIAG